MPPTSPIAVLLINLGSPAAPTKKALRPYLNEFLSDRRVIDLPRWQWLPILHGIVLNTRPKRSAHAYRQIWQEDGAPLIVMRKPQVEQVLRGRRPDFWPRSDSYQRLALRAALAARGLGHLHVESAMRYGEPSIARTLQTLATGGLEKLLIVPMYPQYSDATTASVFDGVAQALASQRAIPELRLVRDWHTHPRYIAALADSIRRHTLAHGATEQLLFSFHGLPARYATEGDPYPRQCEATVAAVAAELQLPAERYRLVYQSRFGNEPWLQPYADETIQALAAEGYKNIRIICPGFTADCLETLEEMAMTNRALFLQHGGRHYDYIPALNDDPAHIELLADLVAAHTQGW